MCYDGDVVNTCGTEAYPRFKKWGTNHGEREEQGAESAWGVGVRRKCPPPHQGRVWGGGYVFSPEMFSIFELKMASFGAF